MPATKEDLTTAVGRLGLLTRKLGPEHPQTLAAKTAHKVVRAELALAEAVNSAPPPTPEQIQRLAALLRMHEGVAA